MARIISSIQCGNDPPIEFDADKLCAECGDEGAAPNGLCLKCNGEAFSGRRLKTIPGRRIQAAMKRRLAR